MRRVPLPDRHHLGFRLSRHDRPDVIADALVRLTDRIGGKVRIAFGRRNLGVAEELSDHLERQAETDAEAGIAVPQVMHADVLEIGFLANAVPGALEALHRLANELARQHVGIVVLPINAGE